MSDSQSKKASIPAWQQAQPSSPTSSPDSKSTSQPAENTSSSDSTSEELGKFKVQEEDLSLLEQAKKFLEQDDVRDASVERKRKFLEGKGVKTSDIDVLLRAEEERIESLKQATSSQTDNEAPQSAVQQRKAATQQPPAAPPIVTYPEFLTQPTKPSPLVTASRLVTTAYIAGSLYATLYGLSRWIIHPMTVTLSSARHELSAHTQTHLNTLNTQLRSAVSAEPISQAPHTPIPDLEEDDSASLDSDPTELYHRDFGTQTTPALSRRASLSSSSSSALPLTHEKAKAHADRIAIMTSHLRDLSAVVETNSTSTAALNAQLSDLTLYLNDMKYQAPNPYVGDARWSTVSTPKEGSGSGTNADGKDDGIEALRSEIRGVKGVLLSARNFPRAGVGAAR